MARPPSSLWPKRRFLCGKQKAIWTDDERDEFVLFIAGNPQAGDVIPETGGVRKLRWSKAGTGKRGGVRVIYFYHDAGRPLYLLMVYAKARQENLDPDEKRAVRNSGGRHQGKQSNRIEVNDGANLGKELIESMRQAAAHASGGKVRGMRLTAVETPNVKQSANPCACRSIALRRPIASRFPR